MPKVNAQAWDLPIRLFHWLLVALMGFSWWSGEQHLMDWHRRSGYAILGLLLFRLYWGFVGSPTARFSQFVRGPRATLAYVRSLNTPAYRAPPGHNPLGGWSVLAILAALLMMVTAGLFAVDVDGLESGPLSDYLSFDQGRSAAHLHGYVFKLLLALTVLHVAAILFYLVRMRQNLITPMITGRGQTIVAEAAETTTAYPMRLIGGIVIVTICTYAIARGFRL